MSKAPEEAVPPHPSRTGANRLVGLGALVVVGATGLALVSVPIAALLAAVGASALGLGLYNRNAGVGVQLVNRAHDAITRGRFADAERLLDQAERGARLRYIGRAVELQRTTIAWRRGRVAAAAEHVERVLSRPLGLLGRAAGRLQLAEAVSLRALARAASGQREGAELDIQSVRANAYATPAAQARAELAQAIVLERAGDRASLRSHLAQRRKLLLEASLPRERAIVRAYQRMLQISATTVYRETARELSIETDDEPEMADWVAAVAPGAAPFTRARRKSAETPQATGTASFEEAADPQAQRTAAARMQRKTGLGARVFVLWALLIVMFLAIWQFLSPDTTTARVDAPTPPAATTAWEWAAPLVTMLFVAGIVAWKVRRGTRQTERLLAGLRAVAEGDLGKAVGIFEPLTSSRLHLVAAQAHLQLGFLAERRADWAAVLSHCDRGLARLMRAEASRIAASDILTPQLLATRAVALAALDRDADAAAEIAALVESFPSFPFLALARQRVALMRAARRGDLETIARLSDDATEDLPLSIREELLTDLARAATTRRGAAPGERQRLQEELRVDVESRNWLEAVAPRALSASAELLSHAADADLPDEALAEVEAAAEAEAREHDPDPTVARIPG